jgi:hypothetical protein
MATKTKTIGQAFREVRELEGKAAVLNAAIGFFTSRYIARDSGISIAKLKHPDDSPVDEAVIQLQINEWEDEVREIEETLASYTSQVISDG